MSVCRALARAGGRRCVCLPAGRFRPSLEGEPPGGGLSLVLVFDTASPAPARHTSMLTSAF